MNKEEVEKFIEETRKYIHAPFLEYSEGNGYREPVVVTHLKSKLSKALLLLEDHSCNQNER